MLKIESDKRRNLPLNDEQRRSKKRKAAIIQKAQSLRNEDKDDVKEMNKMIMYAKVVTIRDKQLKQKVQIKDWYKEEEKKKDLMMEIKRLKEIKAQQ